MILNNYEIVLLQFRDAATAQEQVNAFIRRMNTDQRRIIDREEDVFTINDTRVYEFRFYVEILGDKEKQEIVIKKAEENRKQYKDY